MFACAALSAFGGPEAYPDFACFSLGGQGRVCVTRNGNLKSFRTQSGVEQLAHGGIFEGYSFYWDNTCGEWRAAEDYGSDTGQWRCLL